jgi:hypothetical protein
MMSESLAFGIQAERELQDSRYALLCCRDCRTAPADTDIRF